MDPYLFAGYSITIASLAFAAGNCLRGWQEKYKEK